MMGIPRTFVKLAPMVKKMITITYDSKWAISAARIRISKVNNNEDETVGDVMKKSELNQQRPR